MTPDKMQSSRFELKYVIDEATALRMRDFVRCYLDPDEYARKRPDFSYPVHSIYLDSDELYTYWTTKNGDRNRFKLRVRFYDDDPRSPVFFEIKRRSNNCILKQRCAVRRAAAACILMGQLPLAEDLVAPSPKHFLTIHNFIRLMELIHAKPKAHVAYLREAYVPRDSNAARLTFDRNVRSEAVSTLHLSTAMRHPVTLWGKSVVLELKFTDRFPNWFGELVRIFGVFQRGAAKYADGITLLGERRPRTTLAPVSLRPWSESHTISCRPKRLPIRWGDTSWPARPAWARWWPGRSAVPGDRANHSMKNLSLHSPARFGRGSTLFFHFYIMVVHEFGTDHLGRTWSPYEAIEPPAAFRHDGERARGVLQFVPLAHEAVGPLESGGPRPLNDRHSIDG